VYCGILQPSFFILPSCFIPSTSFLRILPLHSVFASRLCVLFLHLVFASHLCNMLLRPVVMRPVVASGSCIRLLYLVSCISFLYLVLVSRSCISFLYLFLVSRSCIPLFHPTLPSRPCILFLHPALPYNSQFISPLPPPTHCQREIYPHL
jgi:hypothetical protein